MSNSCWEITKCFCCGVTKECYIGENYQPTKNPRCVLCRRGCNAGTLECSLRVYNSTVSKAVARE